jgi:hypothetical protein
MKVPADVTLGWTDDNYGYIRELPTLAEQARPGGSGVYYHVSYWGAPHDYLWLCTTPPALIREEMTKAYDHNARKYWVLNVGDLKPAEMDMDYFLQLAEDEPRMAQVSQHEFLERWMAEQFPTANAAAVADVMTGYYALNFIRRPEFMGFNGYNDGVNRTDFNPMAWGTNKYPDQNSARAAAWSSLRDAATGIARSLPSQYADAFFELVGYPVQAAAAMNQKFLYTDLGYLAAHLHQSAASASDSAIALAAFNTIQSLTTHYNGLAGGKWSRIMSAFPRERQVFQLPTAADPQDDSKLLPASWRGGPVVAPPIAPGFVEQASTVSMNAAHFTRSHDGTLAHWTVLRDLGISGASIEYGSPGLLANAPSTAPPTDAPWLEYDFTTISSGAATLTLHLLPTFPVDSAHRLRYAVSIDGHPTLERDASPAAVTAASAAAAGDGPGNSGWTQNVLRNSALATMQIATLAPGTHTLRLYYRDPGVVFEHLVLTFPNAPPAYPVPPETMLAPH